ncbi:MAG: GDP-mannose 4,6-dehydratase [Pseudomonadota bacterium]
MDWGKKKVLVTGAAGFIGSHLTDELVKLGACVRAFVHYNASGSWGSLDRAFVQKNDIEVIAGDICDPMIVKEAMGDVNTVFHLAALIAIPYSYHAPLSYIRTNIEGTLNILQAAREARVSRVVHTSTSEVYGTALYAPIDEKHPLQGQSPYSASKIGADQVAESFHRSYELPVVTVRPFNTFGPRQSARAIIPTIIAQCLSGKEVCLGSLAPTRDLNYVRNTVDGYIRAAECPEAIGQTFNLGSGREISIGELVKVIARMTDCKIQIKQDDRRLRPEKSEVGRLIADSTKARNMLGWVPAVSLEDGLSATIEWMRGNLDKYNAAEYTL